MTDIREDNASRWVRQEDGSWQPYPKQKVARTQTDHLLPRSEAMETFLTQAAAASTYLTQAAAAADYLTQANAASTYLTQASAAATYLSQANAAATYLAQANAPQRVEQWGTYSFSDVPSLGTGGSTFADVTFPTPFTTAPDVSLTQASLAGGQQWYRLIPYNITSTGFRIYVYNLSSATVDTGTLLVDWYAVEKEPLATIAAGSVVDPYVQGGHGTVVFSNSAVASTSVVFPVPFTATPAITVVSNGNSYLCGSISGPSSTGFTALLREIRDSTTRNDTQSFTWIAVSNT